jgi:hypothetical protein
MKLHILAIAALGALAGCSPSQEESVANQFQNTENAIENAADSLEAEAANATRAAEEVLENQADAVENSIDAIDVVPSDDNKATNKQ